MTSPPGDRTEGSARRSKRKLTVCKIYVDPPEPPDVMLERAFEAYCRLVLQGVLKLAQERRERKRQGDIAPAV